MSAAHASEYTITVNDADRDITAEELFAITNAESEVTRVVKAGAKALNLLVPMPDYRGSWTITNGELCVYAATNGVGAAGDGTDEIFINRTGGGQLSLWGTVIEKQIRVRGTEYCINSRNNAENWITRSITGTSVNFVLNSGTKLHTQGGIFCTDTVSMNAAGSHWYWEGTPSRVNTFKWNSATSHILVDGNEFNNLVPCHGGSCSLETANALSGKAPNLQFSWAVAGGSSTLYIDAGSHAFGNMSMQSGTVSGAALNGRGAGTAATINQSTAFTNTVIDIAGYLAFTKKGGAAYGVDRAMNASGDLEVAEGLLAFTENGSWKNTSKVTVSGTGLLSVAKSDTFKSEVALYLSGDPREEVVLDEDVELVVSALYVNNVRQPYGTYGGASSSAKYKTTGRFGGSGIVFVMPEVPASVNITWDAGGAADAAITNAANWAGDPAGLDFASGALLPTFATTGTQATVAAPVKFKGVKFDPPALDGVTSNAFEILPASDAALLKLGAEGLWANIPANGLASTYTIGVPLQVEDTQDWNIPYSGTVGTLDLRGDVAADYAAFTVTKKGQGKLNLYGALNLPGAFHVFNGTVNVYGADAFAESDGAAYVYEEGYTAGCNGSLAFRGGGYIRRPVTVNSNYKSGKLTWWGSGKTYYHTKPLTVVGLYSEVYVQDGCTLHSQGGITMAGTLGVTCNNQNGWWIVEDKPMKGNIFKHFWLGVRFAVAGNELSRYDLVSETAAKLEFDCDWAFNSTNLTLYSSTWGKPWFGSVDLKGHSQRIGQFAPSGIGTIKSTGGAATLYFTQNSSSITNGVGGWCTNQITGGVSFSKAGKETYAIGFAMTSTGSVEVTEGRFAFLPAGSWLNAPEIRASGTGVLEINSPTTFTRPDAFISDSAKFDIAGGVMQHVHNLYLEGKPVSDSGTYGSSSSPAQHKNDKHFSGTGVIVVHSSFGGTAIFLR